MLHCHKMCALYVLSKPCIVMKHVHYFSQQPSTWDNGTHCICEHKIDVFIHKSENLPDQWIILSTPQPLPTCISSLSLQVYDMNTPVNPTLYWEKWGLPEQTWLSYSALKHILWVLVRTTFIKFFIWKSPFLQPQKNTIAVNKRVIRMYIKLFLRMKHGNKYFHCTG